MEASAAARSARDAHVGQVRVGEVAVAVVADRMPGRGDGAHLGRVGAGERPGDEERRGRVVPVERGEHRGDAGVGAAAVEREGRDGAVGRDALEVDAAPRRWQPGRGRRRLGRRRRDARRGRRRRGRRPRRCRSRRRRRGRRRRRPGRARGRHGRRGGRRRGTRLGGARLGRARGCCGRGCCGRGRCGRGGGARVRRAAGHHRQARDQREPGQHAARRSHAVSMRSAGGRGKSRRVTIRRRCGRGRPGSSR